MTSSHAAIAVFSLVLTATPTHSPAPRPAQIILIRHADEPDDPNDPHLSPAGVKRAEQLVSFITTDSAMTRFGLPVAVFATRTTKDGNGQRTQETVTPLARTLKLAVQTPFLAKDFAALAKRVLLDPGYAGKTVLICWNHEEIPQLARALGITPEPRKWKAKVYDLVYVITYHDGKAVLATSRYGGGGAERSSRRTRVSGRRLARHRYPTCGIIHVQAFSPGTSQLDDCDRHSWWRETSPLRSVRNS